MIMQIKQTLINCLRLSKVYYSRCLALLHREAANSEHQEAAKSELDNGPSFCVIPWKHLHLCDSGAVKICCATEDLCDDNGERLNIYKHSIDQIWNSNHLRRVRREMVLGQPVKECAHFCASIEKDGGYSRRFTENARWEDGGIALDGVTIDNLKEEAKKNNYVVNHKPFDLDLEVTNLCNLACRMCNSDRSSKIEIDPVHNQWAGKVLLISRWAHDTAVIGPQPFMNIDYEGFYKGKGKGKSPGTVEYSLTDGKGKLTIKDAGQKIISLLIRFSPVMPDGHTVKIYINGVMYYSGCPINDGLSQLCEIENPTSVGDLIVSIESPVFTTNEINNPVGVGIEHMEIKRQKGPGQFNELVSSRLTTKKHWLKDNEYVYKEMLANPKKIRHIQFVGGEPLINKEVVNIFNHLIENGETEKLLISFTTNATIYIENIFDKAKYFKKMVVAISLDGFGDVFEYIRYPAKWSNVRDNLIRISKTENIYTMASITYQAYNALDFVQLLDFCDEYDIPFLINKIRSPDYLSIAVLPPKARQVAAQRLREYVENDCRNRHKREIKSFIFQLEAMGGEWDIELVRKFMLFTNDLDKGRNQSFSNTHKELLKYIEEMGYIWTKETLHFEKFTLPPISMQKSIVQTEIHIN